MQPPEEKIQVIEWSLRCFTFGILALMPGLGMAFSLLSVMIFLKTRLRTGSEWNPGKRYLDWGLCLAVWGLFLSLVFLCGILKALA